MFSDFSKIFSRSFLVGHFLPSIMFITANIVMFSTIFTLPPLPIFSALAQIESTWAVPTALIIAWILGVTLLAGNRILLRLLEGYHVLNSTPLIRRQQKLFEKINKEIEHVIEVGKAEKLKLGKASTETEEKYTELLRKRLSSFPPKRENILATAFGNTIRSAEMYSLEVYHMDAIPLWPRILAVVPEEFRVVIEDAKSHMDAAVNIFYLSIVIGVESIIVALATHVRNLTWLIIPILAIVFTVLSYQLGISAARQWGENIKSVFDIYRYDLLKKIGIKSASSWDDERKQWKTITKAFLYHYPLNNLDRDNIPSDSAHVDEGE
jgi:hypothetical protein